LAAPAIVIRSGSLERSYTGGCKQRSSREEGEVRNHSGISSWANVPLAGTWLAEGLRHAALTVAKEVHMGSGTIDKVKGRVKEAAGALADDDKLRNEGKLDQAAGAVKNAAEKAVDKVKQAVRGTGR